MTEYLKYNYLIFFPGSDYYKEMFLETKDLDNAASVFWSIADNFFRRLACGRRLPEFIRRVLFRIFSGILVRRFRKAAARMADPDKPVCFIISRMFFYMLEKNWYRILQEAFPDSKTVVLLTDLISIHRWLEQIVLHQKDHPSADLIYTFDSAEAEKYNVRFHNLPYPDYTGKFFPEEELYDIFFLGRGKDRLEKISQIHDNLTGRGFRCSFNAVYVPKEEEHKACSGIRLCDWIRYEDYLKAESKCKVILEIIQSESSGNTLRVYEAIMLGKKLITNNKHLKDNPAYDPENMFVFENPEDIPDEFLRRKVRPYSEDLKKKISLQAFLEDIEKDLNLSEAEHA